MNFEAIAIGFSSVGVIYLIISRIFEAYSGRSLADTAAANAITQLALTNNQERQNLQQQVTDLSNKVSFEQGKGESASAKIASLETRMRELSTTYEARIRSLENTIKDLEKTIIARDMTIRNLEEQIKELSDTVSKLLTAQTTNHNQGKTE